MWPHIPQNILLNPARAKVQLTENSSLFNTVAHLFIWDFFLHAKDETFLTSGDGVLHNNRAEHSEPAPNKMAVRHTDWGTYPVSWMIWVVAPQSALPIPLPNRHRSPGPRKSWRSSGPCLP